MLFGWLKRYSPRGLYGRAALILLVPIVTLLLISTLIFIQRHYQDVASQMTRSMSLELNLTLKRIGTAPTEAAALKAARALASPLQIAVKLGDVTPAAADTRRWIDFSGPAVFDEFRRRIPDIIAIDMQSRDPDVVVWAATPFGPAEFVFSRYRVAASNPHQFLVLIMFVAFFMSLIAFVFLRNQLRPIRRLAQAATAFGRGRVVPYRPSGAIEVRAAGNAFLDMRARIERQIEQRTLMLSGVSHDLRTPLTRLRLGLSMLEEREEADSLERDVAEMERLLAEFLAFARGDALDDPAETDATALVRACTDRLPDAGGRVTLDLPATPVPVMLRPDAIERALMNLIGNALRYGNRAKVSLQASEKYVVFRVEDDGPGIAESEREEALKPFVRLDASRNQNQGTGVGLGLAIANDIARRHGGALRLGESETLGGLKAEMVVPR